MVILEVILAVCGILCIAASFLLTEDEQKTSEQAKQPEKTVLSDGQKEEIRRQVNELVTDCLLYTSPSPRDRTRSRMPSSA